MHAHRCFPSLLLALALASSAWAQPEYRVTIMAPANSVATDINQAGVVVGNYAFDAATTHGFLNRGNKLVDLSAPDRRATSAIAINDKGQVLGHWTGGGYIHDSGSWRTIGTIPGWATYYTDINNAGYITAFGARPDTDLGERSFLRAPNGSFKDLGSLPYDNPYTNVFAINNRNQITGFSSPLTFPDQPRRAIIWAKGVMRDLGDLGTDPNTGRAINDCGQITGYASLLAGFRNQVAFIYSNGRMTNIDGRPDSVQRFSGGTGINCHGHVVGYSDHLSGFVYRGKRMQSLNKLIDPALGWNIEEPAAINDAGQIAATAYRGNVRYAVRLDLIRPQVLRAPDPLADDDPR